MATIIGELDTSGFFSSAIEEDASIIDASAVLSRILTSEKFRFSFTHPSASVGVRMKMWKNGTGEEIFPSNSKYAELMFSSDTEKYGTQSAAMTRQYLFPVITSNRYRPSPFCARPFTVTLAQRLRRILRRAYNGNQQIMSMDGEVYVTFPDWSSTSISFFYNRSNSRGLLFHFYCEYCGTSHSDQQFHPEVV